MILASMSLIAIPMDARGKVRTCSDDGKDIDPDIGGIGILLGLFLPCLVLLGSLQGRNFRCEGIVYGSMRKCVTVLGQNVAVNAVNSKIMYSVMVFCCSCCALHEAAAGSIYMTYL
jgi:hypothetical protein